MASLKSLAKGSFILLISNIVLKAINFLLLPLYTSYLSPSDYGIVDLALTAISLCVSLFSLCLDTGFFTFFYDKDTDEYKKQVFNTTFFTTLIISFIPMLGIFFAKNLSFLLFKDNYSNIIVLMIISICSTLLTLIPIAQIKIENKMSVFGIINIVIGICSVGLNILMVTKLKLGYLALIITNVTVAIIQFISYIIIVRKKISIKYFNKDLIRDILIYTLPLIPATISSWILDLSDRYFINNYYTTYEVGLYGVANKIVIMLTVFLGAFQTAYPSFVFSNAKSNDAKSKDRFKDVLNIFIMIFLVIGITISIFSKEIIMIMTTEEYYIAYKMVPYLIFAQIAYGIAFLVGAGMSIAKKSKYSMMISWLAAIVNIGLNAILIPRYGSIFAAITTLISFILVAIFNYKVSQRFYKCNYQFIKGISMFLFMLVFSLILLETTLGIKIFSILVLYIFIIFMYKDNLIPIIKIVKEKICGGKEES